MGAGVTALAMIAISLVFVAVAIAVPLGMNYLHRRTVEKLYPVVVPMVPGVNIRMSDGPFRAEDVSLALWGVALAWPGLPIDEVLGRLDGMRISWVPADPKLGTRHIIDEWNRHVAGDTRGLFVRVIFLPGDRPADTALLHEPLHILLEAGGEDGDGEHLRTAVWAIEGAVRRRLLGDSL